MKYVESLLEGGAEGQNRNWKSDRILLFPGSRSCHISRHVHAYYSRLYKCYTDEFRSLPTLSAFTLRFPEAECE
jgi:hypothetical protein